MSDSQRTLAAGGAVTIRGLAPDLKSRLRVRAAHNARSMEAEARAILESALSGPDDDPTDLGAFARGLFAPLGGVELEMPARGPARAPPTLAVEPDPVASATASGSEQLSVVSSGSEAEVVEVKSTPAPAKPKRRRT